jgi:hypothetical protein
MSTVARSIIAGPSVAESIVEGNCSEVYCCGFQCYEAHCGDKCLGVIFARSFVAWPTVA